MTVKQSFEFLILAGFVLTLPTQLFGQSINELGRDLNHKMELKTIVK